MYHISIISSSVRIGRNSHRVALFFKQFIEENNLATAEILDLNEYKFPLFDERLQYMKDPAPNVLEFEATIKRAKIFINELIWCIGAVKNLYNSSF